MLASTWTCLPLKSPVATTFNMSLYGGFERPWPITSISYTEYVQGRGSAGDISCRHCEVN